MYRETHADMVHACRRRPDLRVVVLLTALSLVFAAPASAAANGQDTALHARLRKIEQDPLALQALIHDGRDKTDTFCVYCHGTAGNSVNPDIPNLAEQNPAYLIAQMRQFADGQRKDEYVGVMQKLARTFTPSEEVTIALYFSSMPLTRRPAVNGGLAARGAPIFAQHCAACHGASAMGRGEYPRIAGQQPKYVLRTLRNFRKHAASRPSVVMSSATANLTDTDFKALAAYVASLPVNPQSYLALYPHPAFPGDN